MTLKEHKKHIDGLVEQGHGDLQVVYVSDKEKNSYSYVFVAPSVQKTKDMTGLSGRFDPVDAEEVVCIN